MRASKVTVGSSGKVVYDYPEIGPEAKGSPRVRDLKKKKKEKEKSMTDTEKSVSAYADLFRGISPGDNDGNPGGPGQYQPAEGNAPPGMVAPHRPASTAGAVAVSDTLPGAYGAFTKKKDTDDDEEENKGHTSNGERISKGWAPYQAQEVKVNTPIGEQTVLLPTRFAETDLFRGFVTGPQGKPVEIQFAVDAEFLARGLANNPSAEEAEYATISTEGMTPAQEIVWRSMGFEDGDKDDKGKPAFLKKKKAKKETKKADGADSRAGNYGSAEKALTGNQGMQGIQRSEAPAWSPSPAPYQQNVPPAPCNESWAEYDNAIAHLRANGQPLY